MDYRINPCNIQCFDLHSCLNDNDFVEWKQYNYQYAVGDIIFIYISAPESRIAYELEVEKINIPLEDAFDDSIYLVNNPNTKYYQRDKDYCGRMVRLKLIKKITSPALTLSHLLENGLKGAPQGSQHVNGKLLEYILENLD